jgi:GAF domain-containing protein
VDEPSGFRPVSAARAFASATAALVDEYDVVGAVSRMVRDCAHLLSAEAVGLVVANDRDELELLGASSHRSLELELYQLQSANGPCVEASRTGAAVTAESLHEVAEQWPDMVEPMRRLDMNSVHATPLHWHGTTFGALNVFRSRTGPFTEEEVSIAQAFADTATLAVVHADHDVVGQLVEHARQALAGRAVVEQAKGVIAYQRGLDMAESFSALLRMAEQRQQPLSAVAAEVLDAAFRARS